MLRNFHGYSCSKQTKGASHQKNQRIRSLATSLLLTFLLFLCTPLLAKQTELPDEYKEEWSKESIPRYGHFLNASAGAYGSFWISSDKKAQSHNYAETRLTYAFYLPLAWKISYFLGSSFGYSIDLPSQDPDLESSVGRLIFPGFLFGLSYNISTRLKLDLGASITWSRALGVYYKGIKYVFTLRTLPEIFLSVNYFLSPDWALSGSIHYKRESFLIEDGEIKKILAPLYGSRREALGILFGVSYHKL